MISTTVSISAESYRLWLASHVQQAKSNWCWAACAQMMGEHYNMSGYKNQYQVAYQIQGNYDDDRTDADGLEDAVIYSTDTYWWNWTSKTPHIGFTNSKQEIDNNRPFLVTDYYHFFYIRGYDHYWSGLNEMKYLYVSDPNESYAEWIQFDSVCDYSTHVLKRS